MSQRTYSDKTYIDRDCPICGEEWTLFWYLEENYGSDADGRRGRNVLFCDIDKRGCTHGVEDDLMELTQEQAELALY